MVEEGEFDEPNGLCFSPDEKLMYVNDSPRAHVKVFDVAADGALGQRPHAVRRHGPGEVKGGVDGMECDEHGNVWTTGPAASGSSRPRASCSACSRRARSAGASSWGGPDLRTLFLTTTTTLQSVPTLVRSARVPGNH